MLKKRLRVFLIVLAVLQSLSAVLPALQSVDNTLGIVYTAEAASAKRKVKITKQPKSVRVASGQKAKVTVKATGTGLRYKWYFKDSGSKKFTLTKSFTGNSYSVKMSSSRKGRQVYCVITDKYGNSVKTDVVTLRMGKTLKITKQPKSVTKPAGETAKVTLTAYGDGLTYKWYYKDTGSSKYKLTKTFTGNTYKTEMTAARNGRKVYCVVTDKYGKQVKSKVVSLKMTSQVIITKQPVSVTKPVGETAQISLSATGTGLSYKWYYKDVGSSKFKLTKSFTGTTYKAEMTAARNGRQVYCVVKDKYGTSVKSDVVTLKMGGALKITKQPVSVKKPAGDTVEITVGVAGDGLSYKWYYKNAGSSKFTQISSVTGATYKVKLDSGCNGRQVYCQITDAYGKTVQTNTVTLTVGKTLKITKQPVSVTKPSGDTVSVSVTATGDGVSYAWYYKDSGKSSFTLDKNATGATYSMKMASAVNGRQVYCLVKDAYGKSVKSDTVTLSMGKTLKITKQPASVTVHDGEKASVSVTVSGDGVSYKWYSKQKSATKFTLVSSAKTATYTVEMKSANNGLQVYCVITDEYGKTVETNKVTLSSAHEYGSWTQTKEATVEETGTERRTCSKCDHFEERTLAKLKAETYITVDLGFGEPYKVGVAANGKYTLKAPTKPGYDFAGWKTADSKDFAAEGVYTKNITIKATWTLADTKTLAQLTERTDAGVDKIKITGDIVVDKPIFISYETHIYADGNFSITRDPSYAGDIFVVGETRDGKTSVMENRKAVLSLGGGKGALTIDGNKSNLKVTVSGSAIYVDNSGEVDLRDGVVITNHKKLANDRVLTPGDHIEEGSLNYVGGAAVLIVNGAVNMHGGIIENCEVYSVNVDEAGNTIYTADSAMGGAVYNRSNFNMYGGIIRNCVALRGGAIYTDRVVMLEAGTITGNAATTYAGAVASSGSSLAHIYIGSDKQKDSIIFSNNASQSAGGAVYSNTHSPIVVYQNAVFEGNSTQTIGGAIYTGGPLTVLGATFKGNESPSQGGAIYHKFSNPAADRRYLEVDGAYFEGNKSWDGGAIALGAADNEQNIGTYAFITDSVFKLNQSFGATEGSGSGGAIYASAHSEVNITKCDFEENVSGKVAGALYVHKDSTVNVSSSTFHKNSALYGGAINVASGKLTATDLTMTENTATYGGAFFLNPATVTIKDLKASGNSATSTGGVLNTEGGVITISGDTELKNNTAATRGGAIYITKAGEVSSTFTMTGGILQGNTAGSGGAVSVRATCSASFDGTSFQGNASTDENAENSLYLGGGALDALNADLDLANVTMSGNTSANYGGAVLLHGGSEVSFKNITFTKNTAKSAGALLVGDGTPTVSGATFSENTATVSGGAIIVRAARTALTLTDATLTKNTANSGGAIHLLSGTLNVTGGAFTENSTSETGYGGAILAGIATLNVDGTKFTDNSAHVGAAASLNGTTATITGASEFKNNAVTNRGGAIDVTYEGETVGNLTITGGVFEGNSAVNGGAINVRSGDVTVDGAVISSNTVTDKGAAINLTEGSVEVKNVTASKNTAYGGGAFSVLGGTATFTSVVATENTADNGGALYVNNADTTVTVKNCTMTSNTAVNGGAICLSAGSVTVDGGTYHGNSVTGENTSGGAIYAQPGTLVIKDATFTENTAGYGGAIAMNGATLNVSGTTTFKNNVATVRAGAIDVANSGENIGNITVTDGLFEANEAPLGGAVSMRTGCSASFSGTQFKTNKSTHPNDGSNGETANQKNIGGGAIYVHENGMLTLTNAEFDGNTSENYGGAVMLHKASLTMSGGKIVNSESISGTGAALYLYSCKEVTVTGAEISDNKARWNGAVYSNGGTFTVADVTANGNSADNGAVFYISGGTAELSNITASKNTAKKGGMLYVGGGTVTVNNAAATENTADYGGAVCIESAAATVTLNTCTMTGNTASNGGAVNVLSGTAIVDGGTYSKNAAGEGASGGAIYAAAGTALTVKNAVINENTAGYGGAVAALGANLAVSGTEFKNNSAAVRGGVLEISGNSGEFIDITVTGGIMEGNTAPNGGAVAAKSNYNTTFDGTQFKDNKIPTSGIGGAVQLSAGSVTLKNVTATGNEGGYGGAVFANGGTVNVIGGTYTGNRANEKGGAIHIEGTGALTVNGMTASGNYAYRGSVLSVKTAQALNVTGLVADANAESVYEGGAILADGATTVLNLTNSTIKNNTAANGGAIVIKNGATVNIDGGEYSGNNVGTGSGGAVYVAAGSTLSVKDATMNSNTAGYGGAIAVCGGSLSVSGTTFKSNVATVRSGALEITDNSGEFIDITVTGGLFESNEAPYGGAVATKTNYNVTFDGTEFKNNKVPTSATGGAVQVGAGSVTLKNVTATGNESGWGGAVYANGGTVNVIGGTYTGNRANEKGGALHIEGSAALTVNGMNASDNYAYRGSVLSVKTAKTLNVTGLNAGTNAANVYEGGAILVDGSTTVLNLTDCIVKNNTAKTNGGAIILKNGATVNIDGGEYSNNSAAYGGMIFGGGSSKITVSDSTVSENNASDKGGAIYIEGATLTVTDGLFEANTALNGGALVVRAGDTATITGTEFKNNQATAAGAGVGGAIYVYGAAAGSTATNLTLTNVTFTENKAIGTGGAIATNESAPSLNINATGCTFTGNQAGSDGTSGKGGGALEIRNGNGFSNGDPTAVPMVFTNCTFTDNTSTGTGGAIDVRSGSYVKFDGITATGNESTTGWNGAVIYATSANTRVYLTGTVTASGNKAGSSDTFAYVSSSPAHLYTDHSSTADWVAMTYAAAGTITFDLATMP